MSNIITGARALLFIGGTPIGYCTGVTVSEEVDYDQFMPMDNIAVVEQVPVAVRVTGSADFTRIISSPLTKATSAGYGPMQTVQQLKSGGIEMSMQIKDTETGKVMYELRGVKPQARNFQVASGSIATTSMTFVATSVVDEGTE